MRRATHSLGVAAAIGLARALGMTVLLVLFFFVALITTDYLVTRHRLAREARALAAAPYPAIEPAWVAGYQLPDALYYHRGHTWARPLDTDTVLVGVDDFARRLIGSAAVVAAPSRGEWLHQGGRAFAMKVDGKVAELVSPIEGEVVDVLQDGGEPASDLSHHLPKADWERLAHEFLLT